MISTTTNRVSYTGDGSSAVFSFPYEFFAQSDLNVYLYNSSAQTSALQTLNTNYTVGGTANLQGVYTAGGTVIFNSAVPTTHLVVITRNPSQVQNYQLLQNGNINSTALVQQLDYMTLLIQRLQDQATRSLHLAEGHGTTFDPTLPSPCIVACSVIMVNSSATGYAVGPTADQIYNAQSSAISAGISAANALSSANSAGASAITAQSAAVSATNQSVLAASAALSANLAASIVGSSAFWGVVAQSSALSASNQAVLAASAAVSAGNQAVLSASGALSATNQAVLSASGALSATNQAVLAAASAAQASSSVGAISLPLIAASGGTGTMGGQNNSLALFQGSSAMIAVNNTPTGGILMTSPTGVPDWGSPLYLENMLINSAFDWWQPSGSMYLASSGSSVITASTVLTGGRVYQADQWYVANDLGTNGAITCTAVSGRMGNSLRGCQVQITTAPTAAQANGTELWQVIEAPLVQSRILGQSSFFTSALVKALGNVSQVGIQFFQAGTEVKTTAVSSSLCSEQLFTVNSAAFSACLAGLGSVIKTNWLAGSSGVVGMRIRITNVSTGSTHVLSNGFVVEQAGFWAGVGTVQPVWSRRGKTPLGELAECQRFYTMGNFGMCGGTYDATHATLSMPFPVQMRVAPSISQDGVITVHEPSAAIFAQSAVGNAATYSSPRGCSILLSNFTGMTAFRPVHYNGANNVIADARI